MRVGEKRILRSALRTIQQAVAIVDDVSTKRPSSPTNEAGAKRRKV